MLSSFNRIYKANRLIQSLIDNDALKDKVIIIYPFGLYGKTIKGLLNSIYGIREDYIIDNKLAHKVEQFDIRKFEEIPLSDRERGLVFLASDAEDIYSEVRFELQKFFSMNQIIDLFSPSSYFDPEIFWDQSYINTGIPDYARYNLLESCAREIYKNHVPGSIAECGVFEGHFANGISRFFPDREFFLFDTFCGFDERDITEKENINSGEFIKKVDNFSNVSSLDTVLSRIAWRKNVTVFKGYFPETAVNNPMVEDKTYAFVDLDMDLYKPIKAGLEFFWPRLAKGGSIMIDEIRCKELPSARDAVVEFCDAHSIPFYTISYNCYGMPDAAAIITK